MSIPGQQNIRVGLPNESANSDTLFTAFTKTDQNFANLFALSSPFNTFTAGPGIAVAANANVGTVTITNQGVTNIIAGTNIVVNQSNGNVTISATGSGNGGGLSSVGLNPASTDRLVVTNTPLIADGNMTIDLANSGVAQGTYNNPTLTVDSYGRIVAAANGNIAGTVTSVGLVSGPGIQVSGGPITSNGNITVTNTGVTRINPGSGIVVSSGNGNVTISAASLGGTVTAVGLSSSQLVVTGSPVVSSGTINVELPNNATFTGNVSVGNLTVTGDIISNPTHGCFHKIANVTAEAANTVYNFDWFNDATAHIDNRGVTVTSAQPTRIVIDKAGSYIAFVEMQASNSGNQARTAWVWLAKNGTNIPETTVKIDLLKESSQVIAKLWSIDNIAANDYIEVRFAVSNITNISLNYAPAQTSPFIMPAQPSATITITPIGA